jgi:hypothetical protein
VTTPDPTPTTRFGMILRVRPDLPPGEEYERLAKLLKSVLNRRARQYQFVCEDIWEVEADESVTPRSSPSTAKGEQ